MAATTLPAGAPPLSQPRQDHHLVVDAPGNRAARVMSQVADLMGTATHRDRHGWDTTAAQELFDLADSAGLVELTAVPFADRVLVTATGWPIRPFWVRTPTHVGAGLGCVAFLLTSGPVTGRRTRIHLTTR